MVAVLPRTYAIFASPPALAAGRASATVASRAANARTAASILSGNGDD
jgi:hypothetical protein